MKREGRRTVPGLLNRGYASVKQTKLVPRTNWIELSIIELLINLAI